ncbi:MAG: hypothetical protein EOM76_07755 [Sphingobacteriia bacterium]|nr:hypothetical protein [Sphingobacteriia bacterium]
MRYLAFLPPQIFDRWRVRHNLSKVIKRVHHYTGYFQLYSVPFKYLPYFDYLEKRDYFVPNGILKTDTIFDWCVNSQVPYYCSNWRHSEEHILIENKKVISEAEAKLIYVYLPKLDAVMHEYGPISLQTEDKLHWLEKQIASLFNYANRLYDDVSLYVISDHGMAPVTDTYDLMKDINQMGYEYGRDYAAFYDSTFLNNSYTNDSSRYWSLKNTVSFTLEEDFNRILHFGLAAFVEYDLRYHALVFDSFTDGYYENHLKVGALISKQKGKILTYDAQGDVYVLGPKAGEFEIFGNIHTVFNVKKDVLRLDAGVGFYNETVNNFVEHFSSNHFRWDNDFKNNLRFNAKVRFSVPTRDISIGAQMENVTNLVYFNTKGLPEQYDGNVQVVALDAVANVRVWRFHLDNQFVYQYTSNRDILPLPDFSLYSTLYYKDKFFKVLTFQAGVSVRYHTAYYGPVYVPATGQFRVQNEQLIGNYPVLNAYLNFHLKRMRFYVQYAHWNKGLFDLTNYFSMPNYPINPGTFQFGLSWTFYN